MPDLDIASFIGEAPAGEPPRDAATADATARAMPYDGSWGWADFPKLQSEPAAEAATARAQPWDGHSAWAEFPTLKSESAA
jgi:hypothetical protein